MALTFGVALDFGSRLRGLDAQLERQAGLLPLVEAAGFELVAAGESSSAGAFHLPDALQVLAAISLRTRLRLCTGIALLPAWDPWKLALDAAQLDQLSGGRFVLGVGIGTAALQARAGWPGDAVSQRVDEYLDALRALWSGAQEFQAAQLRVDAGLPIRPPTRERPSGLDGPPIWVGGAVRRAAVRAARIGQGWYAGVSFRLSELPRNVGWYRAALDAQGKMVNEGLVIVNRLALAAPSTGQVRELTETYLGGTLRSYGGGDALQSAIDDTALIGTPDQIVEQVERYRAVGVTHLIARLSLDEMPIEVVRQTIELFGSEVMPRVRKV
jgi:alkanesulfonate monooxygenase SsuD/methylene tetrahydromethanopterin reductase-like flavin-dependent oxidoreductase (luciferase family)